MNQDDRESPNDDQVGYAHPPKNARFKPGLSGNPSGRPKEKRPIRADVLHELAKLTRIDQEGRSVSVTKQQAMVVALVKTAMTGDTRAINTITALLERGAENGAPAQSASDEVFEKAALEEFINREIQRRADAVQKGTES